MARELAKKIAKKVFPADSGPGNVVRKLALRQGWIEGCPFQQAYTRYISSVEPYVFYAPLVQHIKKDTPLFSVVVPFFNTPNRYLQPLCDSLLSQSFTDFEVIMVDASTDEDASRRISAYTDDARCVYVRPDKNLGIAGNTNYGLQRARGKYVVFVDHDDTVSLHALNEMAIALADDPGIDILYSDEDVLSEDGLTRQGPFFKSTWSPHLFLHMNYTNHLSVIRRELVEAVGGLRSDFDGAQDYDLLLRIHELDREIHVHHIPKILYHWRQAHTSTARSMDTKSYAIEAGRSALAGHLDRIGLEGPGVETIPGRPGWYRSHPRKKTTVNVIIWVSEDPRLNNHYAQLLKSRTESAWASPQFLCVESMESAKKAMLETEACVVVRQPVLPVELWWLDELVGALAIPGTAMVAPLVTSPTGERVVSAGLVRDNTKTGCEFTHLFAGAATKARGVVGPPDLNRTVDGLSTSVLAIRNGLADADSLFGDEYVAARSCGGLLAVWADAECRMLPLPVGDGVLNANLEVAGDLRIMRGDSWSE